MFKMLLELLRHKRFVFVAGRKTSAPLWRLLIHDWAKLSPREFFAYKRRFVDKMTGGKEDEAFARAWLHHVHLSPHHWEHWVIPLAGKPNVTLDMPEGLVREMIADWLGAARAYEGAWPVRGTWKWYKDNFMKIQLSDRTRFLAAKIIDEALTP